jgi:hypothetical protein
MRARCARDAPPHRRRDARRARVDAKRAIKILAVARVAGVASRARGARRRRFARRARPSRFANGRVDASRDATRRGVGTRRRANAADGE